MFYLFGKTMLLLIILVLRYDRRMMLIVLAGMRIAAIMGESRACVAKYMPAMLYKMERAKLEATIFFPVDEMRIS